MLARTTLAAFAALALATSAPAQSVKLVFAPDGSPQQRSGTAVADAGVFAEDGARGIAVGAPFATTPFLSVEQVVGRVQVIDASGATIATFTGGIGSEFGSALAGPLDHDLDGRDSVAIGAPAESAERGQVSLRSAGHPFLQQPWSLLGSQEGERLGSALAVVDDLDGDGVRDVIAGAPTYDTFGPFGLTWTDAGIVRVLSGADGSPIRVHAGNATDGRLGTAVAAVGDFDGDLVPDYAAGAPGADRVIVYSGANGAALATFDGPQLGADFGAALAATGDVDGGGRPDLLVGSPGYVVGAIFPVPAGRAAVVRGEDGGTLFSWTGNFFTSFGHAVTTVDLELDGVRDFVVHQGDKFGQLARAKVYSGLDGTLLHDVQDGAQDGASPVLGIPTLDVHPGDELLIGLPGLDGGEGGAIAYGLSIPGGGGTPPLITVDDDGPADFDSVAVALLAAPTGSRIRVEPGDYGPFTIDRRVAVVAKHTSSLWLDPATAGAIAIVEASDVVLAGFETGSLVVAQAAGRTHVADVTVSGGNIVVQDGHDVLLTLVDVDSAATLTGSRDGVSALDVTGSTVHVVDSSLTGSAGQAATFTPEDGGDGGDGVRATSSQVYVALSDLFGGDGGQGGFGGAFGGTGGAGARALTGASIQVRGLPTEDVQAGSDSFPAPPVQARDVVATASGAGAVVTNNHATLITAQGAVSIVPPRPILIASGDHDLGAPVIVRLSAQAGLPFYVALSVVDANVTVPGYVNMPILIDGAGKVFDAIMVGQGDGSFASLQIGVPNDPALIGIAVAAQGFGVPPAGDIVPTNVTQVVIRP